MNKAATFHTDSMAAADGTVLKNPASVSCSNPIDQVTPEEKWEKAGIGNAFIFANVMRTNPDLLLELLQYALPEMEITGFATPPGEEVSIKTSPDSHGIRLDITVRDINDRVFDVEMQIENEKNIPKRIRYYSSTLDQTCLKPGEDYNDIRDAVVLFITSFDPFGRGQYRYTFRNICVEEKDLVLGDGSTKTVLNADGSVGSIPQALVGFLDLVKGLEPVQEGSYASRVQEKVRSAKLSSKLRREFMNWEMTLLVERNKGKAEGRIEGKAEGIPVGATLNLIELVQKKIRKEKPLEVIIDELESDSATIRPIFEAVKSAPVSSTPEQILDLLTKK
ncbi:MAG: Rpn family recombination-promoting nuclease/putative transposase [Eubacteriales bacterium]|nr:Rpn family recombination-promoting nuclease/putative transposase [Eubacteriales bacterium]